jgi:hypothetical protein
MRTVGTTQATSLRSRFVIPRYEAPPLERSDERWMSEEEAQRTEAQLFSHPDVHTPVKAPQGSKPTGSPFEIPPSLLTGEPTSSPKEVESP